MVFKKKQDRTEAGVIKVMSSVNVHVDQNLKKIHKQSSDD